MPDFNKAEKWVPDEKLCKVKKSTYKDKQDT